MQLIRYDGWPVALAGTDGVLFHPARSTWLSETKRTRWCGSRAPWRCTPSRSAPASRRARSTSVGAECFARELLMPAEVFRDNAEETDAELAKRFGVPVEQVPERRFELAAVQ